MAHRVERIVLPKLKIQAEEVLRETSRSHWRKGTERIGLYPGNLKEVRVIQEQFGRGPLLRYCHVSASYCINTLPLGNVVENERVA
jgi:hypothetical protein